MQAYENNVHALSLIVIRLDLQVEEVLRKNALRRFAGSRNISFFSLRQILQHVLRRISSPLLALDTPLGQPLCIVPLDLFLSTC